jgi:threonyl-tRNA synthetase
MDHLDHRSLGEQLELFHFEDEAPGSVFWHPRGFALYAAVEAYMRRRNAAAGYQEVRSPAMLRRSVWERSGHWDHFHENMFVVGEDSGHPLALKPMNCPGHVRIFRHRVRSWRDLPVRLCEFGQCHRNEPSGALHGLLRLKAFVQDDGHIFCREDQVEAEVAAFCGLLGSVYADFGFGSFEAAMSLRPGRRAGSDAQWDRAEAMLASAAAAAGLSPAQVPGEGAFYGPKLEFSLRDRRGVAWQCGVIQLDIIQPEMMGASYRDGEDGRVPPVMLHRAVLGSLERFIGMLLEHHGGDLPPWLAPEQAAVIPVADRHRARAAEVCGALGQAGLRVRLADGQDRMPAKVRSAAMMRIPAIAVVGDRELSDGSVSLRFAGQEPVMPLAQAAAALAAWASPPG